MKINKSGKISALCLFICGSVIFAHAQKPLLEFNKNLSSSKTKVAGVFAPTSATDEVLFYIRFRYRQMIDIKLSSNSVFLSDENECGLYFKVFDARDKELWLGDSPSGIDTWKGEVKTAGIHKIKVYMDCLETYTDAELWTKAPYFKFELEILGSKSASR